MKFEMDKMVKKSEELMKKGEEMAKDMIPKVKDATSDLKDSLTSVKDKSAKKAHHLSRRKDDVRDDVVDFTRSSRKDVANVMDRKSDRKGSGKLVAGVAIAAAAAAAYALYKKNKIKNENLKKEYSEKLTRWAELDLSQIDSETDGFQEPMKVTPKKVYKTGSNAVIDDLVINITNANDDSVFNPDAEEKPVAELDLKKMVLDKTEGVREKIRTKVEEGKLQTKLGSMEAKDKYVEIKDMAEEKISNVKTKGDENLTPNIGEKVFEEEKFDDMKMRAEAITEETKEEFQEKSQEAKRKFEDLKNKVASSTSDTEGTSVDFDEKEGYMKNDMAYDDEKPFEPKDTGKDNFVDEPFGAEEMVDSKDNDPQGIRNKKSFGENGENSEGLKEKVMNMAENAKSKIMPDKDDEELELVEYKVTLHNKGAVEYSFNPMQIQVFDIPKRSVHILAQHEEGTTLSRVTLKPGETYKEKLFVKMSKGKRQGLLFFKDLSLDYSVLFLTDENNPVERDGTMVLDEDYLYSDKEVLDEHNDYKRL